MKPKKIQIELVTPIEQWADANRGVIMDSIYSNVFDFINSKEEDRVVLQITPKIPQRSRVQIPAPQLTNVDFIISKDDIDLTLHKMLEYYVEVEEYEKCAEIVKLQNAPPKKKRGRPKKTIDK
jgi:hypothetical protein